MPSKAAHMQLMAKLLQTAREVTFGSTGAVLKTLLSSLNKRLAVWTGPTLQRFVHKSSGLGFHPIVPW